MVSICIYFKINIDSMRKGGKCGKEKAVENGGRDRFKKLEIQECLNLCRKLKQELENASCIPQEKLSGELERALKKIREFQKSKLEDIFKEILILEER